MSKRGQHAERLFADGYNCAQAVALAFQDLLDAEEQKIAAAAAPFGGGLGGLREVCGALSGGALVLGLLYPFTDPKNQTVKKGVYGKVQELAGAFQRELGSIICAELLGLRGSCGATGEGTCRRTPCGAKVRCAADALADLLKNDPQLSTLV